MNRSLAARSAEREMRDTPPETRRSAPAASARVSKTAVASPRVESKRAGRAPKVRVCAAHSSRARWCASDKWRRRTPSAAARASDVGKRGRLHLAGTRKKAMTLDDRARESVSGRAA
ncbi:hypothetical protein MTO96_002771 [Rhipicephalus appendiculatus]